MSYNTFHILQFLNKWGVLPLCDIFILILFFMCFHFLNAIYNKNYLNVWEVKTWCKFHLKNQFLTPVTWTFSKMVLCDNTPYKFSVLSGPQQKQQN